MKTKITKQELKEIAKSLYFDLSDSQLDEIHKEFDDLFKNFTHLGSFDVDKLKPTFYGAPTSCNRLRKDEPEKHDAKTIISKAKCVINDHVEVK